MTAEIEKALALVRTAQTVRFQTLLGQMPDRKSFAKASRSLKRHGGKTATLTLNIETLCVLSALLTKCQPLTEGMPDVERIRQNFIIAARVSLGGLDETLAAIALGQTITRKQCACG